MTCCPDKLPLLSLMPGFAFGLILLLGCQGLDAQPPAKKDQMFWPLTSHPVYEINFGRDHKNYRIIYFNELEPWARSRNLVLLPDLPLRGLQDFEAAMIPSQGLAFWLDAPKPSRVFLYLDLATYRPQKNFQMPRISWLEVKVNGHSVAMLYQGSGKFPRSPIMIPIEREWLVRDRLHVFLRPSPTGTNFAIWDAFVAGIVL